LVPVLFNPETQTRGVEQVRFLALPQMADQMAVAVAVPEVLVAVGLPRQMEHRVVLADLMAILPLAVEQVLGLLQTGSVLLTPAVCQLVAQVLAVVVFMLVAQEAVVALTMA
jgi:hypothetical protein